MTTDNTDKILEGTEYQVTINGTVYWSGIAEYDEPLRGIIAGWEIFAACMQLPNAKINIVYL